MPLASSAKIIDLIANSKDPKRDMIASIGDLSDVHVMFNMVLLGTYFRPQKTAGGIIRPDGNVGEDEWQGKVGLVLKLGSKAFVDDGEDVFYGETVVPGDWAVYFVNDARSIVLNGYPCRMIRDSSIKLKVKNPNIVF